MKEKEIHAEILQIKKYSWVISIVWLFAIIGSIFWNLYNKNLHLNEMAKFEAISSLSRDNAIREWASKHGGVYVQMDKEVLPNLGLSHIPNRNIIKPNGDTLTLLSPEYMIRQMFDKVKEEHGLFGRTVSLRPLSQNNTPDEWEKGALLNFEKGVKEVLEFTKINGKNYLRLIRPMFIEKSCLKCHASQGYKVGDISGGVSVAVSMDRIQQTAHSWKQSIALLHSILFIVVFIGIRFGEKRLVRGVRKREKMEGELIEKEIRYQTLFEESPTPLWEEDFSEIKIKLDQLKKDGVTDFRKYFDENREKVIEFVTMVKIIRINKAVVELHEANSKEAVLQGLQSIFTEESLLAFIEELIAIANGSLRFEFEASVKTLNGRKKYIYLKWLALPGYEDTLERIYISTVDITKRKQAEDKIKESEDALKEAQRIAKIGHWKLDIANNKLSWSDEIYRIFGIEPQQFEATYEEFLNNIHPGDKDLVNRAYTNSLKNKTPYEIIHRLQLKDGTIKYVNEMCKTEFDENDNPLISIGTIQDITELIQAEQDLQVSKTKLLRAQYISKMGDFTWNIETGEIFWSDGMYQLLKYSKDEIIDFEKLSNDIHHPDDLERVTKWFMDSIDSNKEELVPNEYRLICKDGEIIFVQTNGRIEYKDGKALNLFGTCQNITERKLIEEEIRKSKENLAIAQKIAKVGSWEWDLVSNIMTQSDELKSIYGIDKNIEVSLDEHAQFINKEDKPIVENAMSLIFSDAPLNPIEYRIVLKDGTIKNIIGLAERIFDNNGKLIKAVGTVQDITERKQAEKVRKESEDALKEAQRIASIGHWKLDITNNKLSWSDEIYRIFNIEPQQFEATYEAFLNNIHPDDRDFVDKAYSDSLKNKTKYDIVHRLLLKDGTIKYVNEKCRTEYDDGGNPIISIGTVQDITERTTNEAQIVKLTNAIEQSINSIMITDTKGNIEYINKYFTEVTGYSKEDVIGKNPRFLKTGFLEKSAYKEMWKTLVSGNTWNGEFYNRKKNGEYFWEKATISPIKDSNGRTINYVAVKENITEWKKTEDERLHLEKLVKSSINEIYIFDKNTYKFTYLNDSALKNIGYSFEELKLMTPIDIKPEFTFLKFKKLVEPLVSREKQYIKHQTIHQRKDKTIYPVEISLQIVEHGNVEKFAAIIIDITKRKKVEDEIIKHKEHLEELIDDRTALLKESEETFRALAENSDGTIMRFNRDCKHLYVNPKVTEETGIPAAEFIGKTHENLGFPKELCEIWEDAVLKVFKTKRKNRIEFMLPNKMWIDWTLLPELGDDGEVNAVITFGRDITERKINENRIKESLLKEQELNKIKDQFMSTVSHDLRTPLTAILSSVELMERFYDKFDREQVMNKYGQIKNSVSRITDMLSHVLELSRIERGNIKINFTTFNLKKEFQAIIDEVDSIKNEKHQLIYNYKLEKEEYKVDINLIREILINLLVNGIKYSPNGGRVELLVEQVDEWLYLQVSDEGVGISENEIGSIFNEFYRTEGSQNISGSGLGLSIVKHYIEMYNGKIEVESTLGEGSVFKVKIPLSNNG